MLHRIRRNRLGRWGYKRSLINCMVANLEQLNQADNSKQCYQKAIAAYAEHVYRMETDPIFCLIEKEKMRRFTIYMFFRDFFTFKLYLAAPWRMLREKSARLQNE